MKAEFKAPSWWDRLFCGLLHDHSRWRVDGTSYRRCVTLGCGMLVVKDSPLLRLRRRARESASKALRGGGL